MGNKTAILPDVCPRFVQWDDDNIEELTREEAAMLGFRRCLPDDLSKEFDKVLTDDGRPIRERLDAFMAKAGPRKDEIVAAGWTWWT